MHFIMFADDTNLFRSGKNLLDLINTVNAELEKLSIWFIANRLTLNVSKTKYIIFGTKRKHNVESNLSVSINGISIERVANIKFLGVFIDEDLNWKYHTSQVSLKVSKSLGILNRVKNILSKEVLVNMYYSLIHPYYVYCNIVWGGASLIALNKLIVLQKRAVRLITGSSYRAHTNPLFAKTRIMNVINIHKQQTLLFMFKFKHHLLPDCCSHYIVLSDGNRPYAFRKKLDFKAVTCRSQMRQNFISISGPRLWKTLPSTLIALASLFSFKKRLVTYLLENS